MQNCVRVHDCYTDTNNFPLVLFYSFFTYSDEDEKKLMMIVMYKKIEKNSKKKSIKINI